MHCEVQRQAAILPCARCQHTIARLLPVRRRAADTSTLFLDTLPWLHAAAVGEAAMLADRKLKFVPDMDGFALPNALHWLLLPLSKRTVRSAATAIQCPMTLADATLTSRKWLPLSFPLLT